MKRLLIILFVFLNIDLRSQGFETLASEEYGISIDKPKSWKVWDNPAIKNNLVKFDFTDKEKSEIFANHGESILVFSFAKEKRGSTGKSLIPIVQIYIRPNATKSFEAFNKSMLQSLEQLKNYFKEFEYIEAPSVTEIDSKKSFTVFNKTKLIQNGQEIVSRSRVLAIPKGNYFIQISFTDGYEQDDCQEIYSKIVKTIKITD